MITPKLNIGKKGKLSEKDGIAVKQKLITVSPRLIINESFSSRAAELPLHIGFRVFHPGCVDIL